VACSIVDTIPSVNAKYDRLFDRFEAFSLLVFGAEYLARVWCAPENPIYGDRSESRARLSWARSLAGVVDLFAVAPFIVSLAIDVDLRVLVLLRLLRFSKLRAIRRASARSVKRCVWNATRWRLAS
jgi:voltage-gated potassium channel